MPSFNAVRFLVFFLSSMLAFGCSSRDRPSGARDGGGVGNDGASGRDGMIVPPPPGGACEKMDILFVIDDSGSMAEEQGNLATNFPQFITILDGFTTDSGAPLDYRVGITTTGRDLTTIITLPPGFPPFPLPPITETGPSGALLTDTACGMTRPWIERADGDVSSTFSCAAAVGTDGSGTEMPLLMTEWAITDRVADGMNAGFLREDALLAVVILTDENDCSRLDDPIMLEIPDPTMATTAADVCDPSGPMIEPVSRTLDALDAVKGERGRWAMAVIAGPGPGTCSSAFGDAVEATRLREFLTLAGENTVFSSICEGDLAGALQNALETFDAACQSFPPLI